MMQSKMAAPAFLLARFDLPFFGKAHLLILAGAALLAALLAWTGRRGPLHGKAVRMGLGGALAASELASYGFLFAQGGPFFKTELPLQLCDFAVWLTVIAAFTLNPAVYDFAWFAGIAGSGMALLTPDLWAPLSSWPTILFFLSHGLTVVTVVVLLATGAARPRAGSAWRAFLLLNLLAVIVGICDAFFHANYMYLRSKPANASLLNFLGPWPFYLIPEEAVALLLCWLLFLPFRRYPIRK